MIDCSDLTNQEIIDEVLRRVEKKDAEQLQEIVETEQLNWYRWTTTEDIYSPWGIQDIPRIKANRKVIGIGTPARIDLELYIHDSDFWGPLTSLDLPVSFMKMGEYLGVATIQQMIDANLFWPSWAASWAYCRSYYRPKKDKVKDILEACFA